MKVVHIFTHPIFGFAGGAEHVACSLCSALAEKGHSVTLITADYNSGNPFFPLSEKVKVLTYGDQSISFLQHKIIQKLLSLSLDRDEYRLQRQIHEFNVHVSRCARVIRDERPDICIAAYPRCAYVARRVFGDAVPIILMSHNDPNTIFDFIPKKYLKAFRQRDNGFLKESEYDFMKLLFSFDVCQISLNEFKDGTQKIIGNDIPIVTIPNSVRIHNEQSNLHQKNIVNLSAVGTQKNPILLIEAFNLLKDKYPDWRVYWYGREQSHKYTKAVVGKVLSYGLDGRFYIKKPVRNIDAVLKSASILGFPSIHEGFSLTLTEAMSYGVPVVGLKAAPGVRSLIRNGVNGFLTDGSPESFASGLEKLMNSECFRKKIGMQAKKDMESYSPELIFGLWDNLIKSFS